MKSNRTTPPLPGQGFSRLAGIFPALLIATAPASAAVLLYTSSAAFGTDLGSMPKVVVNYESYGPNSTIVAGTVLNGIRYDSFPAGTLGRIDNTYNKLDAQSLALDRDNDPLTPDYFFDRDQLTITFATPVRAFGVFFNANLTPTTGDLRVATPVGTATTGGPVYDFGTFFFAGLISDTPFSTATIGSGVLPNGSSFNLDDLTYAPVPEPGASLGVLALVGAGVAWRARQRGNARPG